MKVILRMPFEWQGEIDLTAEQLKEIEETGNLPDELMPEDGWDPQACTNNIEVVEIW